VSEMRWAVLNDRLTTPTAGARFQEERAPFQRTTLGGLTVLRLAPGSTL
jgi:hypothetical protein